MRISAFVTITRPDERGDTAKQCIESAHNFADEVVIIDGEQSWPQEFYWPIIGEHFQAGYEQATGDWVFHLDTDFIFHEQDCAAIRLACLEHNYAPALSFLKRQFIQPDRFNVKSRLIVAVNKAKYGDRIRFDSGGDLCQPSLDGKYIEPGTVPDIRIAIWNYEKILKTKAQVKDDVGRMARAWARHFGNFKLGTDDESAYQEWIKMVRGRYQKPQEVLQLEQHPRVMQAVIKSLKPGQFGYDGFGELAKDSNV